MITTLLNKIFHFDLFSSLFARMSGAFVTSLGAILLCTPFVIQKLKELKVGDRVRNSGENCAYLGEIHKNKNNTPTMGGVVILFSVALSAILWMDFSLPASAFLLISLILFGAIGARDDYLKLRKKNIKGMSSKRKFLLQTIFSCVIVFCILYPDFASGFQKQEIASVSLANKTSILIQKTGRELSIPFWKTPFYFSSPASFLGLFIFFVFIIVGSSNAVNLTDGLDGLSSGALFITSCCLACAAYFSNSLQFCTLHNQQYVENSGEIAIFLSSISASSLGFLYFNRYPAKVFMGDVGSITLGALLGICAILMRREILFSLAGALFVIEALSVILQVGSYKLRNKKRIFLCAPLHHHFEYKGWSEKKVVYRFWILSLIFGAIGLLSVVI